MPVNTKKYLLSLTYASLSKLNKRDKHKQHKQHKHERHKHERHKHERYKPAKRVNPYGLYRFLLISLIIATESTVSTLSTAFVTVAHAMPITQTYLEHNSTTEFAHAPHLPYANPNAPKGGTLSLSATGTFNNANKWANTGVAMAGTDYLYDTLMTGSLNEAFTMYPQLAEKVTFDPADTSWITYHINPKAKFWDGSSVTSADVKATFDALLSKGPVYLRQYLGDIKTIETLDSQRVKFNFVNADNKEILLTVGQFPVFKKQSIDANFETISLTPLLGSGAYQLEKVDAGRSVTYKRAPDYWGKDLMVNQGRFNFDHIKYVYYQNGEIEFEGFKSGQFQFREENTARKWATAYQFPAVKEGMVVQEHLTDRNPVPMQGLVMNLRRPLFSDVRVRQALTYAYDFEWQNKTLFYGQYERLQSYFYNSELAATGTPTEAENQLIVDIKPLIRQALYPFVLADWQLPKSNGNGYNREGLLKARALLLQAGFYYDNMKLYMPNGEPAKFEILLSAGSPMARVVLPYVRHLKRLGFDVSVREVDAPQYLQRTQDFDFDMIVRVYAQGLSPGAEQMAYWGSQSADEKGNKNVMGIKDPAIDEVVNRLAKAKNREDIIVYTKVLDRLLRAGFYIVPMYGKTGANIAHWKQYKHGTLPTNAVGLDYWWVDEQAEKQVKSYLGQ